MSDRDAIIDMICKSVAFSSWAAGEGICPINEDVSDPESFLMDYSVATDDDDWETIGDRIRGMIETTVAEKPIKPLVWNEYHREGDLDELDAETPFGTFYSIKAGVSGWHLQYDYSPFIGIFEGLESAIAAAHQDFEKRMRSAYGE